MANQDSSCKQIFSYPDMVRDLLVGFIKEDWIEQLDYTTLEKVGGSYVTDDLRERMDDVIWRVRWGREWLYVYVILEFQTTVDRFMAVRMDVYVMLLYQDLIKSNQIGKGEKLPPVLPVVLYNGKAEWAAALDVADVILPAPVGLGRYRPRMRYLLIDENRLGQTDLILDRNLAAALFRLERSRTPEDVRTVVRELIDWLKAPAQTGLRRAFSVWLGRVLLPRKLPGQKVPEIMDLQEVDAMLAETVQEWTKQWKEEGRQEEAASFLLRLLQRRFGFLPADLIEKVRSADRGTLETWGYRVLDAQALDDIFV